MVEHRLPDQRSRRGRIQKVEKGSRVTVGISGTGGGFQKFCRAEIDISDASRPISASEVEACRSPASIHRAARRV